MINLSAPMEATLALLIIGGATLVLVGSIGLVKLPDFYTRLHAPTKATTLGMGLLLIASMLFTAFGLGKLSVHELLITIFLFISAPITAHMLAKSALHERIKMKEPSIGDELIDTARDRNSPTL